MTQAAASPPVTNVELLVDRLRGSGLLADYYDGSESLAGFYEGWAWDAEAYRRKAEEVASRFDATSRAAMAAAIRPTSDRAAERLRRVVEENGFFVTTGQQAGLFGGPLYTVHKILTAIRLAEALEPVVGRPVAPLFWVASDDHDWAEVNHTELLDVRNELVRIALPDDPEHPPVPVRGRIPGAEIEGALEALSAALPPTEFAPGVLEMLRRHYRAGVPVSEAFGGFLGELFAPFDLLIVDAGHPALKRLATPVLRRELEGAAAHEALLARTARRLEERGYHAQVALLEGAANVFIEAAAGRERLAREDGAWHARRSGMRLSHGDLLELLDSKPESFSPNVLLRPVVEATVFPTISYVAGPSELAYYAQIGCLYRAFDTRMPVIFPRFGVTIVEAKVRKVLDKFSLEPERLRRPVHEVTSEIFREEVPPELRSALDSLRRALAQGYEAVLGPTVRIDPTLKRTVEGARNDSLSNLNELEKKVTQHLKQANATGVQQIEKAALNLFPRGVPQERVLNPIQYLARYGTGLLGELAGGMDIRIDGAAEGWNGVDCDAT